MTEKLLRATFYALEDGFWMAITVFQAIEVAYGMVISACQD